MSSSQGFFEGDDEYRDRVAREADERTIEQASGSSPSQGWFESPQEYRSRISESAAEHIIKSNSGTAPSQGWFESSDEYRSRISVEASETTVRAATGCDPGPGWFESATDYQVRVRREANEHQIGGATGVEPSQGWFEGAHEYRSRIAHEAREIRAKGEVPHAGTTGTQASSHPHGTDSGPTLGGGHGHYSNYGSYAGNDQTVHIAERNPNVGSHNPLWIVAAWTLAGALLPVAVMIGLGALSVGITVVAALFGIFLIFFGILAGVREGIFGMLIGGFIGWFLGMKVVPAAALAISNWLAIHQSGVVSNALPWSLFGAATGAVIALFWNAGAVADSIKSGNWRGRDLPIRIRWVLALFLVCAAVAYYWPAHTPAQTSETTEISSSSGDIIPGSRSLGQQCRLAVHCVGDLHCENDRCTGSGAATTAWTQPEQAVSGGTEAESKKLGDVCTSGLECEGALRCTNNQCSDYAVSPAQTSVAPTSTSDDLRCNADSECAGGQRCESMMCKSDVASEGGRSQWFGSESRQAGQTCNSNSDCAGELKCDANICR
ncbi:MAG: hypothetical protein V4864_18805 [Pseudomonadota bacterium]